ncbi:MAG: serine hydrolase domain-containing protein [Gemmatimonadales bacterium]
MHYKTPTTATALAATLTSWAMIGCVPARLVTTRQTGTQLRALVPSLLQQYHVPAAAIAVSDRGRVVIDTIFTADGLPLSNDHRFEAASLSKPVFAATVMLLAKARRIDLDLPVVSFFDRVPLQDARIRSVTARMLLSHTSGLTASSPTRPIAFASAPGSTWRYSGDGYAYLQHAVEHVTGEPLDALADSAILAPLGMSHSSFVDSSEPADSLDLPGYDRAGMNPRRHRFAAASAASSLRTTAGDYIRFMSAMVAAAAGESSVFPADLAAAMLQPQIPVDSSLGLSWGLGWAVAPPVFFHWGSNPGYKSFAFGDPSTRLSIVILTNGDNGLEIAEPIVSAITSRRYPFFRFKMLHPTD